MEWCLRSTGTDIEKKERLLHRRITMIFIVSRMRLDDVPVSTRPRCLPNGLSMGRSSTELSVLLPVLGATSCCTSPWADPGLTAYDQAQDLWKIEHCNGEEAGRRLGSGNHCKNTDAGLPEIQALRQSEHQNKMVLLPDKLNVPILINHGLKQSRKLSQEGLSRSDDTLSDR